MLEVLHGAEVLPNEPFPIDLERAAMAMYRSAWWQEQPIQHDEMRGLSVIRAQPGGRLLWRCNETSGEIQWR